jgi:hypothetical protein
MDIPKKIRNEVHRGRYSLEACDILVAQSNQFQESEEINHSPFVEYRYLSYFYREYVRPKYVIFTHMTF